ncbi:hypothetical protein [Flavonifractor hominis]|uniref:Uncharacterized protein n=1 Tax=Flavonifractor hominis TaxID=3133178 RepID=A0ABV1EQQ3_9FIRM
MSLSKRLSLTRNRQLGALCWALILAASLCARFFPVRGLPFPARVAIAVVLGAAGVVVVFTTLGLFTEKGDERSAENERRADAALFTLFFLAMGAGLFLLKDGRTFLVGKSELLVIFASICLAKDLLFLAYERWSN